MLKKPLLALTALSLTLGLAFSQPARANTITSIVPAAPTVPLDRDGKAATTFTVSGTGGSDACGIYINYGDGGSPDTRVISRTEGQLPRVFEHTFNKPGQYSVVVKGDRVKSTQGCVGTASTTINVVAQGGGRRRDAAASCPTGWGLVDGSFNRQTGAYSCAPAYPTERLDCGPGLRYFENAGTIGCRPRGGNR
jgi:hypothetical protein